MAVTQQGEGEGGAPRGLGCGSLRSQGFDVPARFRGARLRRAAEAGEHDHDAGGLRGEHEAARGIEVERLGRAPDLADDGGDGRAAGGFDGGAQGVRDATRTHEKHARRIEPEHGETVGGQGADFTADVARFGPDDGGGRAAVLGRVTGTRGERGCKAARGGGIGETFGHDLVQGGA